MTRWFLTSITVLGFAAAVSAQGLPQPAPSDGASSVAAAKPATAETGTTGTVVTGAAAPGTATQPPNLPKGVELPAGFVFGVEDVLQVVFWKDDDMSREVAIRPDGKFSLPLLNDVVAVGLTPEELRVNIQEAAKAFVDDPTVSVVVKAINSRRIYIDGQVAKRGPQLLLSRMTITEAIAVAGGVAEYANIKKISVVRDVNGKRIQIWFNYKDYMKGKNLESDIQLLPGDHIIVP